MSGKWTKKICPCCGKEWDTKKAFLTEAIFLNHWDELGIDLYNCPCHTTLSIRQTNPNPFILRVRRKQLINAKETL